MEFDYVIVGGGLVGVIFVLCLFEDLKVFVCLFEVGGEGKFFFVWVLFLVIGVVYGGCLINLNWGFEIVLQFGLNGCVGYQLCGKGLGGSFVINVMIYICGNFCDYDNWVVNGCDGWGWLDVLFYFKKFECNMCGVDNLYGFDGLLYVLDLLMFYVINDDFLEVCEVVQLWCIYDFNGFE